MTEPIKLTDAEKIVELEAALVEEKEKVTTKQAELSGTVTLSNLHIGRSENRRQQRDNLKAAASGIGMGGFRTITGELRCPECLFFSPVKRQDHAAICALADALSDLDNPEQPLIPSQP